MGYENDFDFIEESVPEDDFGYTRIQRLRWPHLVSVVHPYVPEILWWTTLPTIKNEPEIRTFIDFQLSIVRDSDPGALPGLCQHLSDLPRLVERLNDWMLRTIHTGRSTNAIWTWRYTQQVGRRIYHFRFADVKDAVEFKFKFGCEK